MSRELKFRAWIKKRKGYRELDQFGFGNQGIEEVWVFPKDGEIQQVYNPLDVVVEQYTGLKDRNGKEIYEGDIVKGRWYRAKRARLDTEGEVKFDEGWFCIYDDPDGQDRLGVPVHNCYDLEVIGNIHENKELLDGSN